MGGRRTQTTAPTRERRRSIAGKATREKLMVAAERLFAVHGIEGASLREIQEEAGQSNASVIAYHFGSREGLVRALLGFRYEKINARRAELLASVHDQGLHDDPRTAVRVIVTPLLESIEAGEMFVPLLARLSADTQTLAGYLPNDDTTVDVLRELLPERHSAMPERVRLGREIQLYSSILNFLGEHALGSHRISPAQLSNYVDGWVGMLTAPVSEQTVELMAERPTRRRRSAR